MINQYMYRKLMGGYLVTTDHGEWIFTSPKVFSRLRSETELPDLFEEKGILIKNKSKAVNQGYKTRYAGTFDGIQRHVVKGDMNPDTQKRFDEFTGDRAAVPQFDVLHIGDEIDGHVVYVKPRNSDAVEEFLNYWKISLEKAIELGSIELSTYAIIRKIMGKGPAIWDDVCSPCPAATKELGYDSKGDVFVCAKAVGIPEFRLGNIMIHTKDEVLCSDIAKSVFVASINDNTACAICSYRPFCGLCPVHAFLTSGNIISRPDDRCRILKGMFDHVFQMIISDEARRAVFMRWLEEDI